MSRRRISCVPLVLLALSGVVLGTAQAPSPDELVAKGVRHLTAGELLDARRAFDQAVKLDPKHVRGLHGLGVCMLLADQKLPARDTLDKAATLAGSPTRPLALNRALGHLAAGTVARSIQLLSDYLTSPTAPLDEQAVDFLGSALAALPDRQRNTPASKAAQKLHADQVARLEAANPGHRKWGDKWVTADEYATNERLSAQSTRDLDDVRKRMAEIQKDVDAANAEIRRIDAGPSTPSSRSARRTAELRIERAKKAFATASQHLRSLTDADPSPKWDPTPAPVSLDAATPPTVGNAPTDSVVPIPPPPPTPADPPADASPPAAPSDPTPAPPPPPAERPVNESGQAVGIPVSDQFILVAGNVSARHVITLDSPDGLHPPAEFVRSEPALGLSLLRLKPGGNRAKPLRLAPADPVIPEGGGLTVTVIAFPTEALFAPQPQALEGKLSHKGDRWTVSLAEHPRLAGAAVVVDDVVVGIIAPGPQPERSALTVIPVSGLRAFLGQAFPYPPAADKPNDKANDHPTDPRAVSVIVSFETR